MRKGAPWLKTTLVQCARAAARKKASYFQAQYHRLRARRGDKKAIGAVAASILTTAYHMLKYGTLYEDLGPDYFDKRGKGKHVHRLINRLQKPRIRRPNHPCGGCRLMSLPTSNRHIGPGARVMDRQTAARPARVPPAGSF